ncbi:putative lipoprotein [Chlamydia ibidis]|uniref:Lipoprotein n=3 Tax=Chlamydia ibidis TaxID=1405396 RepID=A0ABP2XEY7_9CHLA|nr:putative lipoprotein [Chlamydia ibidis]EQM62986.1 putative lipoprotein [Chlamydia ibidis 10-1398/6]
MITGGCSFCPQKASSLSSEQYLPIVNHLFSICDLPQVENREELVEVSSSLFLTREQRMSRNFEPISLKDGHEFYNDLSLLRMTQVVPAYAATYESAVILGGMLPAIRHRLDFLIREWQRGVRFKKIVFLSGKRERYSEVETREHFFDSRFNVFPVDPSWREEDHEVPSSEDGIARFVWEQMQVPSEWRDPQSGVQAVFLEANPSEGNTFGSRNDTLNLFKSYHGDSSGRVLFVSSQPFIHLDRCRITNFFDKQTCDVSGPGFSQVVLLQDWAPRMCLHGLAAWVHETNGHLNISQE